MTKREDSQRAGELGFTENEMRTDYARSHVLEGHAADLEARPLADAHDTLDKMAYQARRIRAEHPAAANLLENGAAKIEQLRDALAGEKREHSAAIRSMNLMQNELDAFRREASVLRAEIEMLRLHVQTLEGGPLI